MIMTRAYFSTPVHGLLLHAGFCQDTVNILRMHSTSMSSITKGWECYHLCCGSICRLAVLRHQLILQGRTLTLFTRSNSVRRIWKGAYVQH